MKSILINIVKLYEHSTGYLQGMNFMVDYAMSIFSSDLEILKFFVFLNDTVLSFYYSQVGQKNDGFELLAIFYAAERLLELNSKNIGAHMQKQGISYKHFAASQMLTLFTSVFKQGQPTYLLDVIFDIILEKGWVGFFNVFTAIMLSVEAFVCSSTMEDMIRLWDAIFKSAIVMVGQGDVDFASMEERVDQRKMQKINKRKLIWTLTHLKEAVDLMKGNEATIQVINEEFFAIHQKIKDILVNQNISTKYLIKEF